MARASSKATTPAAADKRTKLFTQPSRRGGAYAMTNPHRNSWVSTAALHKIGEENRGSRHPDKYWQSRAYELADAIGEVGFLLNLKASAVADCWLVTQVLNDQGEWEPDDDERARRVMDAFVGPQGGQRELKRRVALHLCTAGESMLLGSQPSDPLDQGIVWEFLSTDELRLETSGSVYRNRDGLTREAVEGDCYTARCWRSGARFSDLSDSELRRSMPLLEEVLVLTQLVEAVSKSRLSAGILFVPTEMSWASEDDESTDVEGDEADVDDGIDDFTAQLMRHMSAPVEDRKSAAGLVPLIMRGPAELADKVRLIDIARNLDSWAKDLREEALHRLAQSLDAPMEMLKGKSTLAGLGGGNIAGSVDADFVQKHVTPLGQLIADFVSFAYYRPMLETFEGMTPEESIRRKIVFDPSPIMPHIDEASSARQLAAQRPDLLSDQTLLRANGFDDSDMPDDTEIAVRRAWALITTAPAVFGKALIQRIPGFENVDPGTLGMPGGQEVGNGLGGTLPGVPAPTAPAALEERGGAFDDLRVTLLVAADSALGRALERATAKVCSRSSKLSDERRALLKNTPNTKVLETVGPADLATMGLKAETLLDGAWDELSMRVRTWVRTFLEDQDVSALTADDRAAFAASQLCSALHDWTLSHLHDGFPATYAGMRVPDAIVLAVVADMLLAEAVPVG